MQGKGKAEREEKCLQVSATEEGGWEQMWEHWWQEMCSDEVCCTLYN